ncbi:MAG TPA: response regulator [Pyrinomonadaceae bacterium]|nr:response regulator [Pyrinomonadaceae bacterium]
MLIAEGDPAVLSGLSRSLGADDYDLLQAADAAECLRLCRGERPYLALIDAALPGGVAETCARLKSEPETADTFIVVLSAHDTDAGSEAEVLEAGADGFVAIPAPERALRAHVRAFLRLRRKEEELREGERRYREQAEELREANRRLEEYNRLKAEFVANMSHELRTPLTAIIGFAQLAQLNHGREPLPPRYADAFERILRNGQHLLALINDVLDVSKIEAGRMKVHREHVDVVEVAQEAFGELQSLAQRKGLDYRLRVPERLSYAYTDPLRIRQVFINLLSNAIKFTARGSVEAELMPLGKDEFRLVVRDTGIGIEEKSIGLIFERFRQVDGSTTRSTGGAGLGLSIVRQIVELLGGRVEVTSRVGEGTTFTVTLPISAPAGAGRAQAASNVERVPEEAYEAERPARPGEEGLPPLVVVVEDDADSAALLSETLARAGYRVRVAEDGETGLRLARELDPVAVTLDVMMPGMDGWRVLSAMKADRGLSRIPVIVCSIVDNRPLGYSLGATDYLLKPVGPEGLTRALDNVSIRGGGADGGGYVLVIDDEHGVRELLVTALRNAGFTARSASSGETALKMIAHAEPPRAVFCDLMMPNGMSGFEFVARFRSDPRAADIPVVIVTGKDITPDDRSLIYGQIADVIRKGELLMTDVASRLRETLEGLGVKPSDG